MNELKNNKKLLEVGVEIESGSDSKPEDGEVNQADIAEIAIKPPTPSLTNSLKKKSRKGGHR